MLKIQEVRQHDLKDCGACCLLCIIKYYKGYVPLEKIREDSCTSKNGTTAFHLIKAAQNYGFDSIGVKVESIHDQNIYLPAIAHLVLKNGLQHFVVIYQITSKYIYVMDPAQGKIKMKITEFNAIWDNILILLTPNSPKIVHYEENPNILFIIFNLVLKDKFLFSIFIFLSLFVMILTIITNFYFQVAVSSVTSHVDLAFLKFVVIVFLIVYIFKILANYLKNYYLNFISKNLDARLFSQILTHIFNLPLKFIESRSIGEITTRVEELNNIKDLIADIFINFTLNSVLIIGSIITLYFINAKLFFILCLVISIYLIVGLISSKIVYRKIKQSIELSTDFNSKLLEHLRMFTSIKNLNLTKEFNRHLENKLILMFENNFKLRAFFNSLDFIKDIIYELGLFIINTYGIYLIYHNSISVLSLITFNSLILYLFQPVKGLIELIPKYKYLEVCFTKLKDFLAVDIEDNQSGLKKLTYPAVALENLTFTYNHYQNIINNLSFKIKAKDKIFLDGPSGSGKSTICKIIYEHLKDYNGNIKLNNICEKDYSLNTIRQNVLYVGQDEELFTGSIRDNIICYRNVADAEFLKVVAVY